MILCYAVYTGERGGGQGRKKRLHSSSPVTPNLALGVLNTLLKKRESYRRPQTRASLLFSSIVESKKKRAVEVKAGKAEGGEKEALRKSSPAKFRQLFGCALIACLNSKQKALALHSQGFDMCR